MFSANILAGCSALLVYFSNSNGEHLMKVDILYHGIEPLLGWDGGGIIVDSNSILLESKDVLID